MEEKLTLSEINIYPIKSLTGFKVESATTTEKGLKHDRRWLITDENNRFLTQRVIPEMCLLHTSEVDSANFRITSISSGKSLILPYEIKEGNNEKVTIWNDDVNALHFNRETDEWFSEILKANCKLFYMPQSTKRYATEKATVSFADGFPYLILGEAALSNLNSRLATPISIIRFRPNFVFKGGPPHLEDTFKQFHIGKVLFEAVRKCERCVIPNINPLNAIKELEPNAVLATYRREENQIYFGMNLISESVGEVVKVGNLISKTLS